MLKKYSIKIPLSIKFIHCKKRNFILFVSGSNITKTYKLKFKVIIDHSKKTIFITDKFFNSNSKEQFKILKSYRGVEIASLKQVINQMSEINFKRVNLVGVGYRAFVQTDPNILNLKLGYSHPIFVKIPDSLNIVCPKPNIIFISGFSINEINKMVSIIRNFRTPEPYKGKGVLYEYEVLKLKEGKSKT